MDLIYYCFLCGAEFNISEEWNAHLNVSFYISPEIIRSLLDSEESMREADIDQELAIQDMFEPVDSHRAEEVRNLFKLHISQFLFSSLAGYVYRFVYLL